MKKDLVMTREELIEYLKTLPDGTVVTILPEESDKEEGDEDA